jgi:UPF0755 protein
MIRNIKMVLSLAVVVGLIGGGLWVNTLWNGYPSNSPQSSYVVKVEKGDTIKDIGEKLSKDRVISSNQVFLLQAKLKTTNDLQLGDYDLKVPANIDSLLTQIDTISQKKADEIASVGKKPTATVTLKEGINIDDMAALLGKNGVVDEKQFLTYLQDPQNANQTQFPFLPKALTCDYGELKTCAKYYFEGYLYPDTYSFFKNSTPKEVADKMLTNFDKKVWSQLSKKPDTNSFYRALTMASVIEKETGRTKGGVTDKNREQINKERSEVAGVFLNRMSQNISWQSDVTASYGHGYKICQQTIVVDGCKYLDDPLTNTKYNTYIIKGYPIGPVSNPDVNNIKAALSPTETAALFFVMDGTGKTYFADTEGKHYENIEKVKAINSDLGL